MTTQKQQKLKQTSGDKDQKVQASASNSSYGFSLTGLDLDPALIAGRLPNRMMTDFSIPTIQAEKGFATGKDTRPIKPKGFFSLESNAQPSKATQEVKNKNKEESPKIFNPTTP